MEQIIGLMETRDAYFWATHGGAELDLFLMVRGRRYGFEFKYSDAPDRTRSMLTAVEDLRLDRLYVIYPGTSSYALDRTIEVIPMSSIPAMVESIHVRSNR